MRNGLGLGLGAHRKVGAKDPGELPAIFTVTSGDGTNYTPPVSSLSAGDMTYIQ